MSELVLIQGSLNPSSKTALVMDEASKALKEKNINHEIIDLRKIKMEFCDGRKLEQYSEDLQSAYKLMESANGFIIGMPVYCYSVPGPLKNFLDITCSAMTKKPLGIISNAGGIMSYLASADLMKILSFEVNALPVQPTVYSWGADFKDGKIANEKIFKKIDDMIASLMSVIQ